MKRIVTAVLLIPPVIYVIFAGHPALFLTVVALVALLCFREFNCLADAHGLETDGPLGYAAGLIILLVPQLDPVVFVLVAVAALGISIRSGSLSIVLPQASAIVLGVAYVFGGWRCAVGLRQIDPHWLLYVLALNWTGDIAAYYIGGWLGRRQLAPRLSPAKSWEGTAASLGASLTFGVIYLSYFPLGTTLAETLLLTAAANLVGQLGDLCESALKRGAGLKDSGRLLPGHGGWLDRADSTLFSLPLVYFWLTRHSMTVIPFTQGS